MPWDMGGVRINNCDKRLAAISDGVDDARRFHEGSRREHLSPFSDDPASLLPNIFNSLVDPTGIAFGHGLFSRLFSGSQECRFTGEPRAGSQFRLDANELIELGHALTPAT